MKTNTFVPGKIILCGEHAVVYGKLALATSIGLGVTVSIEEKVKGAINVLDDKKGLVAKAVEIAGGDDSLDIKISSELPVGSGLGSSAAVSAAVIKEVRQHLGVPIDDDELFKLTLECEKIAHGNASGIDPACVVYRGLIAYRKGQPFERLTIAKPMKLLLVNSGKPEESTKEMVELVASNVDNLKIVEQIEKLVILVRERLKSGGDVLELLNQNGILLEQMGVVGKYAKGLSNELRGIGCSVKITGAGGVRAGSGMMIVMSSDPTKIKNLLDNRQIDYFETTIGEK